MRKTKAHDILRGLVGSGVQHIFGIPGTHNIEFFDALASFPKLEAVLITDEQSAGFLGDGYARSSGRIAALALVPGAGITHALSGIAEAYMDQVPLLVLAFGVRADTTRKYQLHDIDQLAIVAPVSKRTIRIDDWSRVEELTRLAVQISTTAPCGPVVLEVPAEGMLLQNPSSSAQSEVRRTPVSSSPPLSLDSRKQLLHLIGGSGQIGLYVGNIGGTPEQRQALIALSERLGAPVWSSISAKGLFPENHPNFVWNTFGPAAPPEFEALERKIDLWIALGGRFSEVATASFGFQPLGRVVHVNVDPESLGANIGETLSIEADAHAVVRALLEACPEDASSGYFIEVNVARNRKLEREASEKKSEPVVVGRIRPSDFFPALQKVFPAETAYAVDSGNGLFLAMENLVLTEPRCFLAPTDFSCMGYSVPAGLGAKFANPKRPVVVIPGDGAFLMTGLELLTGVKNDKLPVVFVLRDRTLGQIAHFQAASTSRNVLTDLPEYDLGSLAKAMGIPFKKLEPAGLERQVREIYERAERGDALLVEVPIDYSKTTYFTDGVIKNNFKRYPLSEKISLAGRLLGRKAADWIR